MRTVNYFFALAIAVVAAFAGAAADARVRLTFWSRDTSSYFPHAFVTLKGTLDATGEPVDTSFGYTLKAITPLALFSSRPARIDVASKRYIRDSDAQFYVDLSDEQYHAIAAQAAEWGAKGAKWNLNRRNCVHFAAEAARRAGLVVVETPKLMKKPRSFTKSLIPLNAGRVTVIAMTGADYWAKHPEEEIFGVPERSGGSVLERRLRGVPSEDER